MTVKEAIEVLKKLHNWLDYGAGELEPTANTVIEAIDTVVEALEKPLPTDEKTYTPAEMESFYTWANDNGWSYGELTELWYNDEEDLEGLIIDDVIKIWEETK